MGRTPQQKFLAAFKVHGKQLVNEHTDTHLLRLGIDIFKKSGNYEKLLDFFDQALEGKLDAQGISNLRVLLDFFKMLKPQQVHMKYNAQNAVTQGGPIVITAEANMLREKNITE